MRENIVRKLSEISEEERHILQGASVDMSYYNRAGEMVMESARILSGSKLFGIRTHTRFTDFPRHSHSYVEMIYQVQGSTSHMIDGREELTLKAGSLLLLSRGTEHSIRATGRDDIAVNFILVPAFFDNAAISIGGSNALSLFLQNNLRRDTPPCAHLVYDISNVPVLENLLENLIILELEGAPLQRQELQQKTLELLLHHLSSQSASLVTADRRDWEQAVTLSVLSRIESDVQCTLSALAEEHGMELSSLSRLIRRHTGCTFTELLHTARFNRALALLSDTALNVSDIAVAVGYENTAFFYRNFAKRFGCTPAEYRAGHSA